MPVIRYSKHPLADKGESWDGPGQVAAAEVSDLKVMCTWYAEPGDKKGDFKLPHHRASDHNTVWRGVTAAMGRLRGTDMPDSDRRGCYNHLRRHYDDFDEEAPEYGRLLEGEDTSSEQLGPELVRAAILTPDNPRYSGGCDSAAEVERALGVINAQHARVPLTAEQVYIFPAQMSNNLQDSYFTRMAESSLRNYEQDARAGVPLMNSHRTGGFLGLGTVELPLGRSYEAAADWSNPDWPLIVRHYILRGWRMNGMESEDLIRGIDAGVIRDTSIGFRPGWFRCSICGLDMMRSEKCQHLPGLRYDDVLALAWVENARLIEDSLVYRGATPNAGIVRKAQEALRAGWASEADIRALEDSYQVRIVPRTTWHVEHKDAPERGGQDGSHEEPGLASEEARQVDIGALRTAFADVIGEGEGEHGGSPLQAEQIVAAVQERLDSAFKELAALQSQVRTHEERIRELEPRAALGDQYVVDLVERAVAERVRVQGIGFDAEMYRQKLLQDRDVAYIRAEIASWEAQAKERYTAGRQVKPGQRSVPRERVPAAAYKV